MVQYTKQYIRIFNLFPFQVQPELQDVVFSGDAIHHVISQLPADSRCVLRSPAVNVGNECSEDLMNVDELQTASLA